MNMCAWHGMVCVWYVYMLHPPVVAIALVRLGSMWPWLAICYDYGYGCAVLYDDVYFCTCF